MLCVRKRMIPFLDGSRLYCVFLNCRPVRAVCGCAVLKRHRSVQLKLARCLFFHPPDPYAHRPSGSSLLIGSKLWATRVRTPALQMKLILQDANSVYICSALREHVHVTDTESFPVVLVNAYMPHRQSTRTCLIGTTRLLLLYSAGVRLQVWNANNTTTCIFHLVLFFIHE